MQILLTHRIAERLRREMRKAGRREIGGLLLGEHIRDEVFRVAEISVQRSGGTHVSFVREPREHRGQLEKFFARTGADYTRFNYMGEWHSHPSFEPTPSPEDLQTMQSIVEDPAVGANFVTLLIASLVNGTDIRVSATAFRAGAPPVGIAVSIEAGSELPSDGGAVGWLRRIFRM
jgi:integrative and conjugative element protein (TIGR02256 family)